MSDRNPPPEGPASTDANPTGRITRSATGGALPPPLGGAARALSPLPEGGPASPRLAASSSSSLGAPGALPQQISMPAHELAAMQRTIARLERQLSAQDAAAAQANANGPAASAAAASASLAAQQQQLQQQQQQQQPPPQLDLAAIARMFADSQAAAMAAAQERQEKHAAQTLLLQSLGDLPGFTGRGTDTTLLATEWLRRTEDYFASRELAVGISAAQGDLARLASAINALSGDARSWFDSLPQRPTDWAALKLALRARFCSVPDVRIRVDRLEEFVEKASRLRDKLNVQGMQGYTNRFAQLAGEIPDDRITLHGKLRLMARGLPSRYAEVVLKEDSKEPTPDLNAVINLVLARATQKEQATHFGGSATSSASAAPIGLDAISLAVSTFGWSREDAQRNLSEAEGWAPHDTDSAPSGGRFNPPQGETAHSQQARGTAPTLAGFSAEQFASMAAMFGASSRSADSKKQSQRRLVPSDQRVAIPSELADGRKAAGLCIKCGVANYEPGGRGHNARTCKAATDIATSVADGRKKAGSPVF
jgi:hypothetical protein